MDEQEVPKNPQVENLIKARLKGIAEIVDSGKPSTVWISEEDWRQGGFNETYLQKLEGVVPIPSKTEQISDLLTRHGVTEEIFNRLGIREWKPNAYFLSWDSDYRHIYARTNIPGVYAHQLIWSGSGWAGSLVFISANIEEEKVVSISNIPKLKRAWEEKYKRIENALREGSPQSILVEDIENAKLSLTSENMLKGVFESIPMWDSSDVSLFAIKNGEYSPREDSPPTAKTVDLLLEYGLIPRFQGSISRGAEKSTEELRWEYYKTKFPNVFLHRVYSGFQKDNPSMPPVMKSQTFVTVNCTEEQFKLE